MTMRFVLSALDAGFSLVAAAVFIESLFQRQITGQARAAFLGRRKLQTGTDRFRAVLHDVKAQPVASFCYLAETVAVVALAEGKFVFRAPDFQHDQSGARVLVRVDHSLAQNPI